VSGGAGEGGVGSDHLDVECRERGAHAFLLRGEPLYFALALGAVAHVTLDPAELIGRQLLVQVSRELS
jgi:hypothetical protein